MPHTPPQHAAALGRLCPVHRLDRNVSGLLLFARGPAAANALRLQIQAGDVVKEYVASPVTSSRLHTMELPVLSVTEEVAARSRKRGSYRAARR